MNIQEFTDLILQPQAVKRCSYEQLNALLLKYPHCQLLRQLLLLKHQQDESLHYLRNLSLCAAYAPDRKHLYEFLHDLEEAAPSSSDENA